jgi:NitT/TauT family transport system substrate-binding protein
LPEDVQKIVDVRRFGPGERIVFEPYTREMFERTHRWMQSWDLFNPDDATRPSYSEAVLS